MMESSPAKRKRTAVEHMEIDWSPSRKKINSPRKSSPRALTPRSLSLTPRARSPRVNHSSPSRSSPSRSSPLRPYSPLKSNSPRHLSPYRLKSQSSPVPSPLIPSPLSVSDDGDSAMEEDSSLSPSRQKKSGGGSKHILVAKVKKIVNAKLQPLKPRLLVWLQKYLGDQRLSDYVNKLQFRIEPSDFGTKFPVSVTGVPIVPNEDFNKIAHELSGPILADYPGIFHESDVPHDLRAKAEAHGIQLNTMVAEQVVEFFGRCWDSLGGFVKFHGAAYISINGTHKYYDLASRYWIKEAKSYD